MTNNPQQMANLFNKFFLNKIKVIREAMNDPVSTEPTERLKSWLQKREQPIPNFSLKTIDMNTLRKAMKRIKGKKIAGADWIDSYSLKMAGPFIEESLLHMINLSIKSGIFPSAWKQQIILPLHKKKEKEEMSNYRPVCHFIQVGIILEYVICDQITEHFQQNNLFHPNHHGSLQNHSTATALLHLHTRCQQ